MTVVVARVTAETVSTTQCCAKALARDRWAMDSGHRKDGDFWHCPTCGKAWEHTCDEADGCCWEPKEGGP